MSIGRSTACGRRQILPGCPESRGGDDVPACPEAREGGCDGAPRVGGRGHEGSVWSGLHESFPGEDAPEETGQPRDQYCESIKHPAQELI